MNFVDVSGFDGNDGYNCFAEEDNDPLEILIKSEFKKEELEEGRENNVNEAHLFGTNLAVPCLLCSKHVQVTDYTFRKQLKLFCDSCFKTINCNNKQLKLEWIERTTNKYSSCSICMKAFLCNLNLKKHDCTSENHFLCNNCHSLLDKKVDIVRHVVNCDQYQDSLSIENREIQEKSTADELNVYHEYYSVSNSLWQDERSLLNLCSTGNIQSKMEIVKNVEKRKKGFIKKSANEKINAVCCKMVFKSLASLNKHLRSHSARSTYLCKFCNRYFNCHSHLKEHIRRHTGERPFSCKYCIRSFTLLGDLRSHQLIHTGERPFFCKNCNKSFRKSWDLKRHMRLHTREKPFICKHCDKSFSRSDHLKSHLVVHEASKCYSCYHCGKSFNYRSVLKVHLRIHSDEAPFICNICNKSFKQPDSLKYHLSIHTGEKPYICNYCNKLFRTPQDLTRHVKRMHTKS